MGSTILSGMYKNLRPSTLWNPMLWVILKSPNSNRRPFLKDAKGVAPICKESW